MANTQIEAIKLALEALKEGKPFLDEYAAQTKYWKAIAELSRALEQPAQQEPVAWMYPDDLARFETSETFAQAYSIEMVSPTQGETVPLYTRPQAREPLTDEQIEKLDCVFLHAIDWDDYEVYKPSVFAFARAIEAAHGIKGDA